LAGGDISLKRGLIVCSNILIEDDRHEIFFAARRIVVHYDPAGLTGRSDRRYGLQSILVEKPHIRLIRRDDGSWNFQSLFQRSGGPAAPSPATPPAQSNASPFRLRAVVQHGEIEVIDPLAAKPGRIFALVGIAAHLYLDQGARSSGELNGALRTARGDAIVTASLVEDDVASFARATVRADGVPIAPIVDAFAPTPSFAMETGLADLRLQAYAIDYALGSPDWHLSGDATVRSMRLRVLPLIVPVRDLAGHVSFHDGWLSTRRLTGTTADVPLTAEGALRLTPAVQFALAVRQRGSLEKSRALLAFTQKRPIGGPFEVALRIDGPVDELHVAGAFTARGATYASGVLRAVRGSFFYESGHLTLSVLDEGHAGAKLWLDGDVDLNAPELNAEAIVQAAMPARDVPFAANVNPDGTLRAFSTFSGPIAQLSLSGYGQLTGGSGGQVQTFFSGDPTSTSFGPLLYRANHGEVMVTATLMHPQKGLSLWKGELVASRARLHVRGGAAEFADIGGISASLPSLDTTLSGVALIDGTGDRPDIAIDARASRLMLQGVDYGDVALVAGGNNGHVHVVQATVRGGSAQARVSGDLLLTPRLAVSAALLRGDASADLNALAPAFPRLRPQGQVSGAFAAASFGTGWLLGTSMHSANASIAGVSLRSGAAMLDNTGTRTSLLANVGGAGTDVWAEGSLQRGGTGSATNAHIRAFASRIDLRGIKGFSLPLQSGSGVAFATIDGNVSAPDVAAAATLRGSVDQQPVSGDLDILYAGTTLRSNASRITFAGNRATVSGSVGLGSSGVSATSLALNVRVREGDLSGFNRFSGTRMPLTGAFNANVQLSGSGSAPQLDGLVNTDLGTIRGVAFNDLRGRIRAHPGAFALSGASVQLGSSKFALAGDVSPRTFRVQATSPHVDMTDFNDFFGGADVFAGTGGFNIDVASNAGTLAWDGTFRLDDAALRDYPLGHLSADFDSRGGALRASVQQSGLVGETSVAGTASFRPNKSGLPDWRTARYRVKGSLRNVDLAATLPLIHQENLALSGRLDAQGQMVGTLRNPIGSATFALRGAHLRHMSIDSMSGALSSDAEGVTLTRGDITLPYLTATAQGRYLFDSRRIAGKAKLHAADLASIATAMRVPGSLGGSANADVSLAGTVQRPVASASVDAGSATVYGVAFDRANINATYAPGQISIGNTALTFAGNRGHVSISGELPLQLRPLALGPKDRAIGLTMRAERVDLSVVNPIIKRYATLTGNLNAVASISGKAGNPIGTGLAQIRYASIQSPLQLVPVTNLGADIRFDHDTISLNNLRGNAGKGTVEVQGSAHVVPAEGLRSNAGLQFSTRVGFHAAQVDVPGWLRGTLDGSLDVTRSGVKPYLEGSVAISSAIVPFSAIYALATGGAATANASGPEQAPGVPHLRPGHTIVYGGNVWGTRPQLLTTIGIPTPAPTGLVVPPVDMKVAVTAGKDVRVRGGNAIDLTATGGIVIAGNLRAPTLDGQFYAVRGQVGYFDTNFRLVSGTVTFDPNAGLLPTMDVTAVTNTSGVEITLHITGRVDNLSTDLSSSPSMSRDEIVATLLHAPQIATLTGSTSTAQSALTQTAQNYFSAQLSRSLLYPFESALAQQLNVESVSFIFNPQGNVAIEVRKRFTNSISAVYQTTVTVPPAQSYGVSYRLRDYLSLDLIQTQPTLAATVNNPATSAYAYTTLNLRYQFH
jgi:autotransporter translocation and assembly factor TamB